MFRRCQMDTINCLLRCDVFSIPAEFAAPNGYGEQRVLLRRFCIPAKLNIACCYHRLPSPSSYWWYYRVAFAYSSENAQLLQQLLVRSIGRSLPWDCFDAKFRSFRRKYTLWMNCFYSSGVWHSEVVRQYCHYFDKS